MNEPRFQPTIKKLEEAFDSHADDMTIALYNSGALRHVHSVKSMTKEQFVNIVYLLLHPPCIENMDRYYKEDDDTL